MTFHEVMEVFEGAGIDMRKAYWGHPERPGECCNGFVGEHIATDGDLRFVIRVDGRDLQVGAVSKEDGVIVVCAA